MNTAHHNATHRPFLHGYYVLPCCSARHCGYETPSTTIRRVRQPSFTIESILNRRASPPPNRTTAPVDYLRTQGAVSLSTSLSTLQRLQPYPVCYSRTLSPSIETKGDCTSTGKREWKAEKPKRVRTIFSPDQLERLEKEFDNQQYIVGTERFYLAAELGLTETQVKVWFQNRRIKWRKQNLDIPKTKEEGEEEEEEEES
ncbi:hypothetical protein QZH41_009513 [Actinostola sp. cb2023]|nr:hypothetical protein QZH41_009513 [Actinostola sp. cb2023]